MPVVLLSFYAKSVKVNLSQAEWNELKKLIPELVREFTKGRRSWMKVPRGSGRLLAKRLPPASEAIAWAKGDDVPVRVTRIEPPAIDVRVVRRKLRLSQS